jgi:hypothetical protein
VQRRLPDQPIHEIVRAPGNFAAKRELEFLCGSQPKLANQEAAPAHSPEKRSVRLSALVLLSPRSTLENKRTMQDQPVRSRAMLDRFESISLEESERSLNRVRAGDVDPGAETVGQPRGWAPFFTSALVFVGAVSFYDGYLVVRTGDMIEDFEKNPIGLYLIKIDNGSPFVFLRVKAAGTVLALAGLSFLHRRSKRLSSPIMFALIAFQTGLLIFLEGPFS